MDDGLTEDERRAVNSLQKIFQEAPDIAETMLSLPWLADGVTEDDSLAIYRLQVILREEPAVAEAMLSLPWLADGLTQGKISVMYYLREMLREDPAIAEAMSSFPWLADGLTGYERNALHSIQEILRKDRPVAVALLNFPWLADGITEEEMGAVESLRGILREDSAVAETLLRFPWVADGVNEEERLAVRALRDLLREDPAMAKTVLESTWFSEGVTSTKRQTVQGLSRLYRIDRSSLSALTTKPWFKDGLSAEEFRLVGDLGHIANRSETDAFAIIGMPFLETFELADAMAVRSLRRLACCSDSKEFRRVMAHPTISDGISDDEAKIVATLHSAQFFRIDIFDPLLDPDTVTLEERTIDLPHTGEMQLTIVRIRPGAERTMDLLERAVRLLEGFVEMPFPIKHVIFLAENTSANAVYIDFSSMSGEHEQFDTEEEYTETDAVHVLVHEASHHYWNREWTLHWIEDGLGAFFQSLVRRQAIIGPGETVVPIWPPHNPPCPITSNIAELERLHREEGIKTDCSDASGERLFQDLWRNLGDSVFRQGLANLYVTARSGAPDGGCAFAKAGMCKLEFAFKAAASAGSASIVDKVLDRWFYNSEPYDYSHLDTSPPNPKLPGGVEVTRAYISLDRDRPEETRTDSFSARELWDERVFLSLHFSFPEVQQAQEIPLTVVEYFEDGFPYRVRDGTHTLYPGRTQGSRTYHVGAGSGYTWIVRASVGKMEAPPPWAEGRYWVSVYHGEQKVAEVEFEVTP